MFKHSNGPLLLFQKVGRPFFPWHYFTMVRAVEKTAGGRQNEATDAAQEEICRAGGAILMALQQAPLVMEFLAGEVVGFYLGLILG